MTEDKFREVYCQYYPLVKKVVYSVLHDADFSEDVCQEVFILFAEKENSLDEVFYRSWFVINARRKAIDFCRKAYQVHEVTSSTDDDEMHWENSTLWNSCRSYSGGNVEEEITHKLELQELTGQFFEDLAKKNSDWYEIVMRMHIEGENAEETARALGISIGSLRAKRHRIKAWIDKYYRNKYENT